MYKLLKWLAPFTLCMAGGYIWAEYGPPLHIAWLWYCLAWSAWLNIWFICLLFEIVLAMRRNGGMRRFLR